MASAQESVSSILPHLESPADPLSLDENPPSGSSYVWLSEKSVPISLKIRSESSEPPAQSFIGFFPIAQEFG
jgi:hypothetical protein